MRLKELKCENCGASVEVDENASQAECEYCHTKFAVEDAYHDGYKFEKGRMKAHDEQVAKNINHVKGIVGPIGKVFAIQYIITAIISVAIIATVIIMIIFAVRKEVNSVDEFDISRFNGVYEMYKGSELGTSVGRLIDEISTNNKKDKEHQITLNYKNESTKDPAKMKEIKKQLDDWTRYEITFEYDESGFIYLATIEE